MGWPCHENAIMRKSHRENRDGAVAAAVAAVAVAAAVGHWHFYVLILRFKTCCKNNCSPPKQIDLLEYLSWLFGYNLICHYTGPYKGKHENGFDATPYCWRLLRRYQEISGAGQESGASQELSPPPPGDHVPAPALPRHPGHGLPGTPALRAQVQHRSVTKKITFHCAVITCLTSCLTYYP